MPSHAMAHADTRHVATPTAEPRARAACGRRVVDALAAPAQHAQPTPRAFPSAETSHVAPRSRSVSADTRICWRRWVTASEGESMRGVTSDCAAAESAGRATPGGPLEAVASLGTF